MTAITNGANTETFTYDANGNTLTHNNPAGENKTMLWDESNMLKAIRIADQLLQHYIYDADGERTLKGKGNVTVVSVNGVPQSTTATIGNYTIYESGYIVVGPNGYVTKHYYNGSERVSSRLGGSVSGYLSGAAVGGAETASLPARQQADLTYVFGQFGLGTVTVTNQPPAPGDCEVAGNCASNLYYFHPDHVGSSTFLSDQNGQPYQFLLYLPFGESMASQKAGGWATPYKFNGKELDDETGMYYYGARYYDPTIGIWHGVDPLADHPNQVDKSPYAAMWNNPIKYNDPDGRCPDCPDETYVPIANHVYEAKVGAKTSNGWEVMRVDNKDNGYGDGYQGALYKGTFNGKTEYIYATAGTDFTSAEDWVNNGQQIISGNSPQYATAVDIARTQAEATPGVSFTGHSLGGGLASANALAVEGKAVTFNAAGLSDKTKENPRLGLSGKSANISAYVVQGEAVSHYQGIIGLKAEGTIINLPASYVSQIPFTKADDVIRAGQRAYNHTMSVVTEKFYQFINK